MRALEESGSGLVFFALLGYFFRAALLLFLGALSLLCALLIFIITKLTPFLCLLERARPKSVKGIKVALCYVVLCVYARARALLEVRDEFFHKRLTPSFCELRVERAGCLFLKKLRDFSPPARWLLTCAHSSQIKKLFLLRWRSSLCGIWAPRARTRKEAA